MRREHSLKHCWCRQCNLLRAKSVNPGDLVTGISQTKNGWRSRVYAFDSSLSGKDIYLTDEKIWFVFEMHDGLCTITNGASDMFRIFARDLVQI